LTGNPGFPVETEIQFFMVSFFRRAFPELDIGARFWIPAGVYPALEYGRGMTLFLVNHGLLNRTPPLLTAAGKLDGGGEGLG